MHTLGHGRVAFNAGKTERSTFLKTLRVAVSFLFFVVKDQGGTP